MKHLMIAIIGIGLAIPQNTYSQTDDFLKNYKAPDFKQKLLNLDFRAAGNGRTTLNNNFHSFGSSFSLIYDQRINSQRYQGVFRAISGNSLRVQNSNQGVELSAGTNMSIQSQSTFYMRNQWFFGLDGSANIRLNKERRDITNLDTLRFNLGAAPTVSFGHGRIEPISYARYAMDINKMLRKADVMNEMSREQLTSLSDKITVLMNKRYYDVRLARIYQLESVDSTLTEEGLEFDRNMRFFSRLQDAFYYSLHQQRFSGFRHEIGVSDRFSIDFNDFSANNQSTDVFYKFSAYIPQSYALQHDVQAVVSSNFSTGWFASQYTFGFYPTTRTAWRTWIKGAAELSASDVGLFGELGTSLTYYISPKLRFETFLYMSNADYYAGNGFIIPAASQEVKRISYQGSLKLTYSIF